MAHPEFKLFVNGVEMGVYDIMDAPEPPAKHSTRANEAWKLLPFVRDKHPSYTAAQIELLYDCYSQNRLPTRAKKEDLVKLLRNKTYNQVDTFFEERRRREKNITEGAKQEGWTACSNCGCLDKDTRNNAVKCAGCGEEEFTEDYLVTVYRPVSGKFYDERVAAGIQ